MELGDIELITRKLLIITVGSSASIHLLGSMASKYPDLLFRNKIMIIETSKKCLGDAINYLTYIYHSHYVTKKGKNPEETKMGFPSTTFKAELKSNSVLLAEHGGATTPELGLSYYNAKRNEVLDKISSIVHEEEEEKEVTGIIILGATGKGTGTLITPALTRDLLDRGDMPRPFTFVTLPFRFEKTALLNCKKMVEAIKSTPVFILDYERALGMHMYLTGEAIEKSVPIVRLWKRVVEALSTTLATLIEALNLSTKCNPPMDWSDITRILKPGRVGTIAYTFRQSKDEFIKNWMNDISTLLLMRTKTVPQSLSAITIIRGVEIPFEIPQNIEKYYSKRFNAKTHDYFILEHGKGYTIVSLLFGFDPSNIYPPLIGGKSLIGRLLGI